MRRILILALASAAALAFAGGALAQQGRLQTKSYQPIGKQKMQVDLTVVDAGELYRDLRDYMKQALIDRGNPLGTSGALGAKIVVEYAAALPQNGQSAGSGGTSPYSSQSGSTVQLPDKPAPAFRPSQGGGTGVNAMHITITIYREKGGAVMWTGEATCYAAFSSAKLTGRAMVDQLIEHLDKTFTGAADCPT